MSDAQWVAVVSGLWLTLSGVVTAALAYLRGEIRELKNDIAERDRAIEALNNEGKGLLMKYRERDEEDRKWHIEQERRRSLPPGTTR